MAVVNGFGGNSWCIRTIKTAKAYAEDPAMADKTSDFTVVLTGPDVPAQLGAIEDFINQGYDTIVTIAVSPEGFHRVIRLADNCDVVLVPFDNVLDTDKVMPVNEFPPCGVNISGPAITSHSNKDDSGLILGYYGCLV